MLIMKKIILMTAGAFDWRIQGIYDTKEQLLEILKKDWGCDELTLEHMDSRDWQRDNEIRIEQGEYFPIKK